MQKKISQLTEEQIQILKQSFEVLPLGHDLNLVYENQVPNAGVVLIEGEIELTKKSKVLKKILPFSLLGIHYLLKNEPVSLGCRIKRNSKIMLIGKSELIEIFEDSKSKLFQLLNSQT